MPIPIILSPPPALDRSIVPAFQTNFNRIRDALLKALGGDYQTGVFTAAFVAVAETFGSVTYPTPFSSAAAGPMVLLTPMIAMGTGTNLRCLPIRSDNNGFWWDIVANQGGAITGNFDVRWVAFYP